MKMPPFRRFHVFAFLSLSLLPLAAGPVILSDNFNAPDATNFDNSDQTGRRGGLLAENVQLRSARIQSGILANRLNLLKHASSGDGRIRFHDVSNLSSWWNFASGDTGTLITADGGLRVEFDWYPPDNTSANWVSFAVGFPTTAVTAEPATRINHAETDFGILLRDNGAIQCFDNAADVTGTPIPNFDVSNVGLHHVVLDYAFTSFDDGSNVSVTVSVDGVKLREEPWTFQWANNNGALYLELGNYVAGTTFDNFSISTLADDGLVAKIDSESFYSSVTSGALIGTLSATFDQAPENATFALVGGTGDTDNGKFKINGNRLEANGYDFTGLPDDTLLSVRIQATGSSPGRTAVLPVTLRVIADSDSDQIPDKWELEKAGNLTDLKGNAAGPGPGAGTGNYDGDTLTDLQEYNISTGVSPHFAGIDPKMADTDSDGVEDGLEVLGDAIRPPTNPLVADTDKDGLSDGVESNTGIAAGANDSGTNPAKGDSDGDVYTDSFEIERGSNPSDNTSLPVQEPAFSVVLLTDDASSGIATTKTYTHAVSGGYAVTINGVNFQTLGVSATPDNFVWAPVTATGATAAKSEIAAERFESWVPDSGSVTGSGLRSLLGGLAYSSNGADPGAKQTYTLTGLTPGKTYDFRLYVRMWTTTLVGRPIDLLFTNGSQTSHAFLPMDRPQYVLPGGNPHDGYYLNYHYTAEGDSLVIDAAVPASTAAASGSMHLYGLTNEESATVTPPTGSFVITSITYTASPASPSPKVVLTFPSTAGKTYAVDYSTSLTANGQPGGWTELVTGYPAGAGSSTSYTDTTIAGTQARVFYRVRQLN